MAMAIGWFLCAVLGEAFTFSIWATSILAMLLSRVEDLLDFPRLNLCHCLSDTRPGTHVLIQSATRLTVLLAVTDLFAFLTVIYGGFAMSFINGIPLWNTALLPILYVISGLLGAEVTLVSL